MLLVVVTARTPASRPPNLALAAPECGARLAGPLRCTSSQCAGGGSAAVGVGSPPSTQPVCGQRSATCPRPRCWSGRLSGRGAGGRVAALSSLSVGPVRGRSVAGPWSGRGRRARVSPAASVAGPKGRTSWLPSGADWVRLSGNWSSRAARPALVRPGPSWTGAEGGMQIARWRVLSGPRSPRSPPRLSVQ